MTDVKLSCVSASSMPADTLLIYWDAFVFITHVLLLTALHIWKFQKEFKEYTIVFG